MTLSDHNGLLSDYKYYFYNVSKYVTILIGAATPPHANFSDLICIQLNVVLRNHRFLIVMRLLWRVPLLVLLVMLDHKGLESLNTTKQLPVLQLAVCRTKHIYKLTQLLQSIIMGTGVLNGRASGHWWRLYVSKRGNVINYFSSNGGSIGAVDTDSTGSFAYLLWPLAVVKYYLPLFIIRFMWWCF